MQRRRKCTSATVALHTLAHTGWFTRDTDRGTSCNACIYRRLTGHPRRPQMTCGNSVNNMRCRCIRVLPPAKKALLTPRHQPATARPVSRAVPADWLRSNKTDPTLLRGDENRFNKEVGRRARRTHSESASKDCCWPWTSAPRSVLTPLLASDPQLHS